MKTAVVFFADGFEMIEALTPVDYMRRAKINVITVAVPSSTMKDEKTVTSSHNVPIKTDMSFSEYFSQRISADALVCPGGSNGAKNLSLCTELLSYLEKSFDEGKIVSAICASPAVVLGKTKILAGKKWTCYPGMNDEAGENIVKNSFHQDGARVVLDGNVLTATAAGASEEFAIELCSLLAGKSEAERVAKSCCLR